MSNSLRTHGLQQARLLCLPLSPGVCSNSCLLSQWWYQIISPSVILFSFCPQSFPSSVSFPLSQLFTSGGQSMEFRFQHQSYQWVFRVDFLSYWLAWSRAFQGTLRSLLQHHNAKALILQFSAFFMVQPSHPYMTIGKTRALSMGKSVGKVMSLHFNTLSRFVTAFLPRSKRLLISQLQSPSSFCVFWNWGAVWFRWRAQVHSAAVRMRLSNSTNLLMQAQWRFHTFDGPWE